MTISIIDYGMGNIRSITNALDRLKIFWRIVTDPDDIYNSPKLILPGVGSFPAAMKNLQQLHQDLAIKAAIAEKGSIILGICLGMQLLATSGEEDGLCAGLGLVSGNVERFLFHDRELKVPHIGFNRTCFVPARSRLFSGLGAYADFYYVHSYRLVLPESHAGTWRSATADYGGTFVAAIENGSVFGVQFHPEKSQSNGLTVLKNFSLF